MLIATLITALVVAAVLLVGLALACLFLVVVIVHTSRGYDEVVAAKDAAEAKVVTLIGMCHVRGQIIRLFRQRVEREAGLAAGVAARSFGHRN